MLTTRSRSQLFLENFIQDVCFFFFFLLFLCILRGAFLIVFKDTLATPTPTADILLTLWYGLRLSLKTVAAATLVPFLLGTVIQSIWPRWPAQKIRLYWGLFCGLGFSVLFHTRIPYFKEFHQVFSPFLFNTLHDDVSAIVQTSIDQYQAHYRVVMALAMAVVVGGLWVVALRQARRFSAPLLRLCKPGYLVAAICVLLIPLSVFLRFGGSFTFQHSIYWKNAARMNQHILNEAIVDDVQAIYRASRIYKKLRKNSFSVDENEVRAAAARLMGREAYTEDTLLPLLERRAPGLQGPKPDHIFVVIAETYMMWPLLEKYKQYPLADGMRRLLQRPDALLLPHFLPASNGTMFGVSSVILGIPELNLFTSNQPTAREPYETSLPYQLKQHGYKARFFYGGYPSWDDIGTFVQDQQMEGIFVTDFDGIQGVWGVPDREFLEGVSRKIGPEPSVDIILTSSNHPPFRVDTTREPDLPTVDDMEQLLPAQTTDRELTASRMWHFRYADHYLTQFIERMLAKYPNSLFIVTGDHADRWTIDASPSDYERMAVPFILIGPAVKNIRVSPQHVGSHMDVAATVLEAVLPAETPYYALGRNLFAKAQPSLPVGVAAYYYITPKELGQLATETTELLPGAAPLTEEERHQIRQHVKDIQKVAAWRVLKGLRLNE